MRIRLLDPSDARELLTTWPIPGIRAVAAIELAIRGLSEGRLCGAVIENPIDASPLGFGLSGFVSGATVDQAAVLEGSLVLHVLESESKGNRVLLPLDGLQQCAAQEDLHLVVLSYRQRSFEATDPQAQELLSAGHKAYRLLHEGYRLRAVWQEGDEADAPWLRAGGMLGKRTCRRDGSADRAHPVRRLQPRMFGSTWPSHHREFHVPCAPAPAFI